MRSSRELRGEDLIGGLIDIGESLTSSRPLDRVLIDVLRQSTEILGCNRCSIMLWDGQKYRAAHNYGNPPDVAAEFMRYSFPRHAPVVEEAHRTHRFVVINDAKRHPALRTIAAHANIESIVVVPMFESGGRRLGIMTAEFNEQVGTFDELDAQVAAGVASLVQSALASARDRRERRAAEADRLRVVNQLVRAEQRERQRISADIHDDVLQRITSLGHFLEILADGSTDPEQQLQLRRLEGDARDAAINLRQLVDDLHPVAVESSTLASAIAGLAARTRESVGLRVSLAVHGHQNPGLEAAAAIYRIAQQALDNTVAHATATTTDVTLRLEPPGVRLLIVDDGVGFLRSDVQPGHIGLFSMTQRAERLGGTCTITSAPGAGTTVEAFVPCSI